MANIEPRSQKSVDKICEVCVYINGLTLSVVFLGMSKMQTGLNTKKGI